MRARVVFVPLVALLLGSSVGGASESAPSMVGVGPGTWRPLYPAEGEEVVRVPRFLLDVRPVTNAEFLAFVTANPRWRRDRIPTLFAGENYLGHWAGPTALGDSARADQPVTNVTWWSARAYCKAQGSRLPREAEWELAAQASATAVDASTDPEFLAKILGWYSRPTTELAAAGSGEPNVWGVRDLHGLVWEWVDDFQSALVAVDNREDGTVDTSRFCGAGAIAAANKEDYAAFMRLAFRSSLRAEHATQNLGFRCARDADEVTP